MSTMSQSNDRRQIFDRAFATEPFIRERILKQIDLAPTDTHSTILFADIAEYVIKLQKSVERKTEEPMAKKRKLNGDTSHSANSGVPDHWDRDWTTQPTEIVSFSVPQRKKLQVSISTRTDQGIRATQVNSSDTEFGIPWKIIENVVCLPVPEKTQATYNFCVFPRYGNGIASPPDGFPNYEPMVWTVAEAKLQSGDESVRDRMIATINSVKKVKVLSPEASEFVSEVPQPSRKGEKAYHVKAFRGSKDGFLFFLSTGIVWGFKKPLAFFSFDTIDSISYTSVLQRTFNLNITTKTPSTSTPSSEPITQEFEFSMIDQADFAGIDAYLKRHRLQDASMAEQRRAKKYDVNGIKGENATGVAGGEEESELAKAAKEVEAQENADEDEEEEDDENFDPGSEGESEGSGTSDEEEQDDDAGGGDDKEPEEMLDLEEEDEDEEDDEMAEP